MVSPYELLQLQMCDTKTIVHWFVAEQLSMGKLGAHLLRVILRAMCENCNSPHLIVAARLNYYKPDWKENILCIWNQKGLFFGPGDSCHSPHGSLLDRFSSLLPKKHTLSTRPLEISPYSWHHPTLHQESQQKSQNGTTHKTCIYLVC